MSKKLCNETTMSIGDVTSIYTAKMVNSFFSKQKLSYEKYNRLVFLHEVSPSTSSTTVHIKNELMI